MKDYFPGDNRELFLYRLVVFMATGFVIIYLFTFPTDLVLLIVVFVSINIYRRALLKKLGIFGGRIQMKGIKGFFKSLFQSPSSYGNTPLKYYCMACGNEHKEIACPKCGSKMKRVW